MAGTLARVKIGPLACKFNDTKDDKAAALTFWPWPILSIVIGSRLMSSDERLLDCVLLRETFHVEGDDDLRGVRLAQAFQIFQAGF